MRRLELQEGIMLETEEGKPVGQSKIAAREGITMVTMSRVAMAAPGNTRIVLVIFYQMLCNLFQEWSLYRWL